MNSGGGGASSSQESEAVPISKNEVMAAAGAVALKPSTEVDLADAPLAVCSTLRQHGLPYLGDERAAEQVLNILTFVGGDKGWSYEEAAAFASDLGVAFVSRTPKTTQGVLQASAEHIALLGLTRCSEPCEICGLCDEHETDLSKLSTLCSGARVEPATRDSLCARCTR